MSILRVRRLIGRQTKRVRRSLEQRLGAHVAEGEEGEEDVGDSTVVRGPGEEEEDAETSLTCKSAVVATMWRGSSIAILIQILAALIMHAPGLLLLLSNTNVLLTAIKACVGAILEGLLLFEILRMTHCRMQENWQAARVYPALRLALLIAMECCIILLFLFGDYVFQDQSGGLLPNAGVVVAGLKESHRLWNVHMNRDPGEPILYLSRVCLCFAGGIRLRVLGEKLLQHVENKKRHNKLSRRLERKRRIMLLIGLLALLMVFGAWAPVVHGCASVVGYALWPSQRAQYPGIEHVMPSEEAEYRKYKPNVILLIHESTSGSVLFQTKVGRTVTPFIQRLTDDPDFHHFRYGRAVSGNTIDAVPSILAGCLPITEKGRHLALTRSIATDFKRNGYPTASFSSADLNFETDWQSLEQFFTANFDEVHDPTSNGFPLINVEGADDRLLIPVFEKWWRRLQNKNETASSAEDSESLPRFAQFYLFNSHYPYVHEKNSTLKPYIASLQSLDQTMERLFAFLNETGQLNNTVVIGSSDHGEHTRDFRDSYGRLSHFNPPILQTFTYVYMPSHLASKVAKDTLRYNTHQAVSTLDVYATLQHVLTGNTTVPTEHERDHCVTGIDLLGTKIPDNRVVLSWNGLSSGGSPKNILTAVSDRHRGFFLRRDQQQAVKREINFRTCKAMSLAFCYKELKNRTYWEDFSQHFQNASSPALKETFVFELLQKELAKKINSLPKEGEGE